MTIFKKNPSVMSLEDQEKIPPVPYGIEGMAARPIINPWMHDSKLVSMGTCDHAPDMNDLPIQIEEGKCEVFYCAKGSLWLTWEDDEGNKGELKCKQDEFIWLPGGDKYKYVLKGTGEQSKNVWVTMTGAVYSEEKLKEWFNKYDTNYPEYAREMEAMSKE